MKMKNCKFKIMQIEIAPENYYYYYSTAAFLISILLRAFIVKHGKPTQFSTAENYQVGERL